MFDSEWKGPALILCHSSTPHSHETRKEDDGEYIMRDVLGKSIGLLKVGTRV